MFHRVAGNKISDTKFTLTFQFRQRMVFASCSILKLFTINFFYLHFQLLIDILVPSPLCHCPVIYASLSRHFCVTFPLPLRRYPVKIVLLSRNLCVTVPSSMRHCPVTFASLSHYLCVAIPSKLCYFPVTFESLSRHCHVTFASLSHTFASLYLLPSTFLFFC